MTNMFYDSIISLFRVDEHRDYVRHYSAKKSSWFDRNGIN